MNERDESNLIIANWYKGVKYEKVDGSASSYRANTIGTKYQFPQTTEINREFNTGIIRGIININDLKFDYDPIWQQLVIEKIMIELELDYVDTLSYLRDLWNGFGIVNYKYINSREDLFDAIVYYIKSKNNES